MVRSGRARDGDIQIAGLVFGQMLHPRAKPGGKHHYGFGGLAHAAFKES